ncbi:MAG TPA: rhombosortase [Moraxellaceae bacterium]|nr:rhombosortase [Moraxellaceae bacterium]
MLNKASAGASPLLSAFVLAALFIVLALWRGSDDALCYQRELMAQGQWWRAFTGHFVHLNLSHALLNSSGAVVMAWVLRREIPARDWWRITLVAPFVISLGLWFKQPSLVSYVGFSGVLHALLYFGVLRLIPVAPGLALTVLAVLVGRQVWEQTAAYNPDYLRGLIHGRVMPDAHLFGALTGSALGLWSLGRERLHKGRATGYSPGNGSTPDA